MSSGFHVVIDGPSPAINRTYKIVQMPPRCPTCNRGVSRLAKAESVETWQDAAAWLVRTARPRGWAPGRRVRIEIAWWTPKKKDGDAGVKALLDAIAVGLNMDDAPFLHTIRSNEVDKANPRTEVWINNE